MKVLFLTIALSLFSILHAEESNSSGELGGIYHINAIVANKEVPEEKKPEAFSPITIFQLDNGNVEAKFTIEKNGKCKEIIVLMEKTENANEYIIQGNFQHSHKVRVTQTSVPNNWIFECEGHFHGKHFKAVKLLSPKTEADPQAIKEYQEIAKERSYDESKIIFPKQGGKCHATIISVYAPTITNPDEVKDKFYEDLETLIIKGRQTYNFGCLAFCDLVNQMCHFPWRCGLDHFLHLGAADDSPLVACWSECLVFHGLVV
ncbi:late lactation protein B-like [Sarcophilus harrisii]|uniref:late lactation protein B-like n=1 Tax=Sarcophilus harrisii TaxID=9305 RepID=UPI001301EFA0|nr:late lactation protein B-like [Sarcophilus harrisii]